MITKKQFGRTGHRSSRTLFGSAAFWSVTQDEADRILDLLFEYGVNHIDTAASYGDAELHIGPWMPKYRNDFFLATKTMERSYRGARDELHKSLDRLKTDHVDLWQIHAITSEQEWEDAMRPGGAIDAFIEAKEQGLARFLGVTGHGLAVPRLHIKSLEKFDFDAVLLPYNYVMMQNPDYALAFEKLAQLCAEKDVALQTIKSIARGQSGHKHSPYNVWYDPLDDDMAIDHAVKWVLGNEQVFLNTVGDIKLLEKVLKSAANFDGRPMDDVMQGDIQKYGMSALFTAEFSGP